MSLILSFLHKDTFRIYILTVSICLLFAGGRIASSDETLFFLETQSLLESGTFAIPEGIVDNGARGTDGRYYAGAGIGFTVLSIPTYLLGKLITAVADLPVHLEGLVLKSAFSLTNQFLAGWLAVLCFLFARGLGFSRRTAFALTITILLTTNLFPYTKTAMRDIAITVCFVGAAYYLHRFRQTSRSSDARFAGGFLGFLLTLKTAFVIVVPLFVLYSVWPPAGRPRLSLIAGHFRKSPLIHLMTLIALGGVVVLVYQAVLFGHPLASGYSQRNTTSFSTPLAVGLYGLLFSSGKSFFLYAPVSLLLFVGAGRLFLSKARVEMFLFVSVATVMLVFHAKFFSWAADGSWGPRYLLPLIPFAILPAGWLLEEGRRSLFRALAIVGFVIQLGGSSVYLGSYLRYVGEFPFTRSFADPEFMYKTHFIPNFSPITGHWELLFASIERHAAGEMQPFDIRPAEGRLPVSREDQKRLAYVIDYWFMYGYYAGAPPMGMAAAVLVALLLVVAITRWASRSFWKEPA